MPVPPTSPRRSGWLLAVLAAAALHMLIFDRGLGGDGWAGFAVLASLADDHDLWLEDNHRGQLNGLVANPAGHLVSQYPPGGPLLDALPFAAGRALDALLPARLLAAGVELPPLGRVPRGLFFSAAAIVAARNVAVLLGLYWTALALRRLGCGPRTAAAAAALAFFGGPLVFYSLVGMTHAPAFALAALLFLLLVRMRGPRTANGAGTGWEKWRQQEERRKQEEKRQEEERRREGERRPQGETGEAKSGEEGRRAAALAWAAGLTLGAAVLVRYDAVTLLPPALLVLRGRPARPAPTARREALPVAGPTPAGQQARPVHAVPSTARAGAAREPARPVLAFALGLALPLLALPPWWRASFGSWLPPTYGGRLQISLASPWNILFSPVHGACWFHPALLLAVAGLALGTGVGRPGGTRPTSPDRLERAGPTGAGWRAVALVWFLSVATLHGWWSEWSNLGGYGQRFLCDVLPVLALGFAWLGARAARSRRLAIPFAVATLTATVFGFALFFAAVGGLVQPPPPYPWPLRLGDYARLVREPPGPREIGRALCRASFTARLLAPGCRPAP
jgi:hypothetical protein